MSKISQLTTAIDVASNDLFEIVDVSDTTTMPGEGGTNKKITAATLANQLATIGNYASGAYYTLTPNTTTATEGTTVTFTVVTTNINVNTLYWDVATPANDTTPASGTVSLNGNTGTFNVTVLADSINESTETFTVNLRTTNASGPIVATSTVGISDTSVIYTLTPSSPSVNEGSEITFVVTATNTPGTTLYWSTPASTDIFPTSGVVPVINNVGTPFTVMAVVDSAVETGETFTVRLHTGSTSGPIVATSTVNINDTSADYSGLWSQDGTISTSLPTSTTIAFKQAFGGAVASNANGDIIAIAAPGINGTNHITRVAIYRKTINGGVTSWANATNDIFTFAQNNPGSTYNRYGHSIAMNDAGNRIAIGSSSGTSIIEGGHIPVQVYEYDGVNWNSIGNIYSTAWTTWRIFGQDIDMDSTGNRIVIGSVAKDTVTSKTSIVEVFQYNGASSWQLLGSLITDNTNVGTGIAFNNPAENGAGFSVAINAAGDRIVIGAPNYKIHDYDVNNNILTEKSSLDNYTGFAQVYQWSGGSTTVGSWSRLGATLIGDTARDAFGYSVAINSAGDRIAIGARYGDGVNGASSGRVKVFRLSGSTWVQMGSNIDGEALGDESGYSISLNADGSRVAIGSPKSDGLVTSDNNRGSTRVYQWDGTTWNKLGQDLDGENSGDASGAAVLLNSTGNMLLVGDPLFDGVNTDSGRARVYKFN